MSRRPPRATRTDTLFPYTTLFRSQVVISNSLQQGSRTLDPGIFLDWGRNSMDTHGYSAAERLERLPISGYHRIIFIIIALAFFFDSMDLAMMTFLLGSIKAELDRKSTRLNSSP